MDPRIGQEDRYFQTSGFCVYTAERVYDGECVHPLLRTLLSCALRHPRFLPGGGAAASLGNTAGDKGRMRRGNKCPGVLRASSSGNVRRGVPCRDYILGGVNSYGAFSDGGRDSVPGLVRGRAAFPGRAVRSCRPAFSEYSVRNGMGNRRDGGFIVESPLYTFPR